LVPCPTNVGRVPYQRIRTEAKTISIDYSAAAWPIRDDFAAAHARFWQRLAKAGSWWTAAERIAIAREVRDSPSCSLCVERKRALSPNSVSGEHRRATNLPRAAIEVIHRVTTDPGRLTRAWFDGVIGSELSVEQYVEIIGTLVAIKSIDSFCRAVGLPLNRLPDAEDGVPSGYRPNAAKLEDAWVPMIPADANTGAESDLWTIGRTGNVIRAMSLVPDEVRTLGDLGAAHYLPNAMVMDPTAHSPHLDRQQMELIAARVSALNQCFY